MKLSSIRIAFMSFLIALAPACEGQLVNYVSTWSSSISYLQNQVVLYSGNLFLSLANANVGNTRSKVGRMRVQLGRLR